MERTFNATWLVLIVLTIISAVFANLDFAYAALIILGLSFLKFIGVAFFFMELKRANVFWRVLLVAFVVLLLTVVWAV
ncbi:MAG: cytochrome C oxidase subunit IV family protein [Aequorivita sp.]|nr:cytochrome C oxidase subunit IV family protein [Aequorivita sp.]HPE82479.1 cytochrome C oxidase subunit IV family protein [Aequorivita sp.]